MTDVENSDILFFKSSLNAAVQFIIPLGEIHFKDCFNLFYTWIDDGW